MSTFKRPTNLMRSAAAAAIACLVAADAYASDPVESPAPATDSSISLRDRLASDEPLFMHTVGAPPPAGTAVEERYYPRMGVLRDPRGKMFGFTNTKPDQEASLFFGAMGQFRNAVALYDDLGGDEEFENGLEFARLQTYLTGSLGNPDTEFRVGMDWRDGSGTLTDAYGVWYAKETWAIRAGQYKNPLGLEWLTWSGKSLAVERSLAHFALMGDDRVQGVSWMLNSGEKMRTEVSVHDGAFSQNTEFLNSSTHFGVTGRFEYLLNGEWADYKGMSSHNTVERFFALGGAAGLSWDDGSSRLGHLTADGLFKQDKMSIFGALYINPNSFGGEDFLDFGGTAQFGYLMNESFEPYGRVSFVIFDEEINGEDTYFEFTVGTNWYPFTGVRRVSINTDLNFLPGGSPFDIDQANYAATDEFELVWRAQAQVKL